MSRTSLTANTEFHVDPVYGSDANSIADAQTSDPAKAWKTIQYAYGMIKRHIDTANFGCTIKLNDGTHNCGLLSFSYPVVGGTQIYVTGNPSNPSAVVLNGNIECRDGSVVTFDGFTLNAPGAVAISASQFAVADVMNLKFGAATIFLSAFVGGCINQLGNLEFAGNATFAIASSSGGFVNYGTFQTTLTGNPSFNIFAFVVQNGVLTAGGVAETFSGSATGQRYFVDGNGSYLISCGATFPGNAAGVAQNGGFFS